MPRKPAKLWDHMHRSDNPEDKMAICNYCDKSLSYRSTINNLKKHLRHKHAQIYSELQEAETSNIKVEPKKKNKSRNSSSSDGIESEDDPEASNPLSTNFNNIFERETGGRARCVICSLSLPNQEAELVVHLKRHHPKWIANASDSEEADTKNISNNEEPEIYTETIYFDGKNRKKKKKKTLNKIEMVSSTPKVKRIKYSSSDDDYRPLKRNKPVELTKHEFEVDNFLKYLSPLLKEVPEEQFIKLQMDVINLVMTARMNKRAIETISKSNFVDKAENVHKAEKIKACVDRPTPIISMTVPKKAKRSIQLQNNDTAISSNGGEQNSSDILQNNDSNSKEVELDNKIANGCKILVQIVDDEINESQEESDDAVDNEEPNRSKTTKT